LLEYVLIPDLLTPPAGQLTFIRLNWGAKAGWTEHTVELPYQVAVLTIPAAWVCRVIDSQAASVLRVTVRTMDCIVSIVAVIVTTR